MPQSSATQPGLRASGQRTVPRASVLGICILLAVGVLLVFGRSLGHDFVDYDDNQYFYNNPHVLTGFTWHNLAWGLQTNFTSNWHPLTWWSLMLDATIFGKGPFGPHLTNILLHAANTVLLFLFLRRITGALWRSAFVAALFGIHPLHVESVAWISERKDVLSGLFFMLTLLAYASYVEKLRARRPALWIHLLAIVLFALGLMAKGMLVTLPFVMLLLDGWPLNRMLSGNPPGKTKAAARPFVQLVLEKLPFFILSAASCVVTLMVQGEAEQPLARISLGTRVVNALVSCARYLGKMFWPVNLAIPYPYHGYAPIHIFAVCAVALLVASFFALRFRRRWPFLFVGWFWYVGMLVPVIGLVQVGIQSMADRYTYLPSIGVFIALAWGLNTWLEHFRIGKLAVAIACFCVLGACAARSADQLRYWQNSRTLFLHTVTVTGSNAVAEYNLGLGYFTHGATDEAITHYRKAIEILPSYDDALNNLGAALALKGDTTNAIIRIQDAIRLRPGKADAFYNLGNVLVMQKRWDDAAAAYVQAVRLKPDYPEAHNNLANVLLMLGNKKAAAVEYRETLRLDPNHESARRQLKLLESQ